MIHRIGSISGSPSHEVRCAQSDYQASNARVLVSINFPLHSITCSDSCNEEVPIA